MNWIKNFVRPKLQAIVGKKDIGSEKGIPNSIISTPQSGSKLSIFCDDSKSGSQDEINAINAFFLLSFIS